MPCINFLTEILPGPALAVFAFRPVASNSHNAAGFKSRRNTKQLVLPQLSINLKTPRKCGVLNFYGEGARSVYFVVSPVFAPVYYRQEHPFGHSIFIVLRRANSSFLPLFQPCTGRK